ncbi:putative ATP-grasp-modified RiPP [Streptomyces sioyaensis]|uniref:putative ATP-grasp-modified RiPP n=1 Tax=Streptomyces sioyaensis TaxID=67364 RepID=UPI003D7530CD
MLTTVEEHRPAGRVLDAPELRLPLSTGGAASMPELSGHGGPAPFAFRFLTPVPATGGILPSDVEYDEESQTGVYEDLPPGVYMTKNPPKTYEPTAPTGQMDAPDDPGPSDD